MAKEYRDLIVGLDIGTSKIMSVVAEVQSDSTLKVLGLGVASSSGMKRGVVVNIEACVQSIQQAIREAERSVETIVSDDLPRDAAPLRAFDCIIFVNVPHDAFDALHLQALRDAVYNFGVGFLTPRKGLPTTLRISGVFSRMGGFIGSAPSLLSR